MKRNRIIPALFLGLLTAGMLLILILPKDSVSSDENRTLAKFPKLSAKALASGSFTSGINSYMNDHFPFRDVLIGTGNKINSVLTYSGGEIQVAAGAVNGDMGVGETLLQVPEEEDAAEETKPPEPAKIDVADEADYNSRGIIISGTRAMELFKYSYNMIRNYAVSVNSIAEAVPDVNVYSLVVPTSVEFYSPVQYHSGARSQKSCIDDFYTLTAPSVKRVDGYTYIASEADDYLYFRTDHHWTARGAYQGYRAFCIAAGIEAAQLNEENKTIIEGFKGTLYNATKSQILADNPDYVEVFTPPEVESCTAYTNADMKTSYGCALVVDPGKSSNKYLTFIGGDNPLVHVVTKNKNGRRLLMLKDSFGNALSLFLVNNYEELYIIDPRSATMNVAEFCAEHSINDILIENYSFGMSISEINNGLMATVN